MLFLPKVAQDFIKITPIEPDGSYLRFYRSILEKNVPVNLPNTNLLSMYKFCKINPHLVRDEIVEEIRELLREEIGSSLDIIDEILQPI